VVLAFSKVAFATHIAPSLEIPNCSWISTWSMKISLPRIHLWICHNPSFGLTTTTKGWKGVSQKCNLGIAFSLPGVWGHYYKMWVQFISPYSLDQWIHYFFISPCSLQPMNSLLFH
jgi:hypothetical protein